MTHDVIVVGGSFAGLSAAMQLARARRTVLVIDAGRPRNRFSPASHGFLGQDGNPPLEIMATGRRELLAYPSVSFIDGEVVSAKAAPGGFDLGLGDGRVFAGRRLVLATGVRDELAAIEGLWPRWGCSVIHCPYCHGYEVSGHALGVIASGPMAIHQALLVTDWGTVTYFSQGVFEPNAEQMTKLAVRGIAIERAPVVELLGAVPELDGALLDDGRVIALSAVFVQPKAHLVGSLAAQLGCESDDTPMGQVIRIDDRKQTTVKGVYAAGDAASPMWNATLAAAAGLGAGVCAHQSLVFD